MAGSTSNLDLIATAQAQKEVTANALFDAGSTAVLFGRRASGCVGLTWAYYGGAANIAGTLTIIANGTVELTASATNYLEVDPTGVVSANTTAFTAGSVPLYEIITGLATASSYTDWRLGTTLHASPVPVVAAFFYPSRPLASTLVGVFAAPAGLGDVTFAAAIAGSSGKALTAATAQTDFDVRKNATTSANGTSVGTVRFAVSGTVPTFIAASPFTLTAGTDWLTVWAPASPDTTLADIAISLYGTR